MSTQDILNKLLQKKVHASNRRLLQQLQKLNYEIGSAKSLQDLKLTNWSQMRTDLEKVKHWSKVQNGGSTAIVTPIDNPSAVEKYKQSAESFEQFAKDLSEKSKDLMQKLQNLHTAEIRLQTQYKDFSQQLKKLKEQKLQQEKTLEECRKGIPSDSGSTKNVAPVKIELPDPKLLEEKLAPIKKKLEDIKKLCETLATYIVKIKTTLEAVTEDVKTKLVYNK